MRSQKRILYIQHANPAAYPPLVNGAEILMAEGWQTYFLGVHSLGTEDLDFASNALITSEILPYTAPGFRQKLSYQVFLRRALALAR